MFRLPIVKFFNRIFNRVTITVVLVALQVLWLLWAFWSFTAGRVWLNGALKALSILIVLYLVRKDENSAYKIGWIVLIGLLPLLGGALYLAFGNKAPAKYLRERMQKVEQAHQTELAQPEGQTDALDISSRNLSRYVAKFGPYPAWRDTAAHYFSCGEEMYPQLLADLEKAEKFIFLEFFILRSGKMWDGVEQILRRKAAQGVDVRLIYDDFGSLLGLPSDFVIRMEKAHIRCISFNPVVPLVSLVMNHRDHRKIVVVDGNVAYTGGVNLADEYINAEQRFGYWKDAAIRLEGAAVWNFTVMFLNVWNAFRLQETDYTAFAPTRLPAVQDGVVQPYADSPLDEEPLAEVSSLKKGWAEQADAFASYLIGMTPEQVSMLKVDKDGKPTDADLLSGCTIAVDRYRDAVTRACANARALGAAKGDRAALGIEAVNGTSDITATDDKDVNAQVDVSIVALTTDANHRVTSAIADMAEPALTVVSDGGVTAPDLVKTKLELGEDYGMRGASALGKEWYEHSEGFCDALKGKTRTEIAGLSGGDADLKALCTIDITDLQKAALDALS